MSSKRIYYWLIYLTIVIASTYVFKRWQQASLEENDMVKYSVWIIYGIIVLAGYKNFVHDPRNKNE